MNIHTLFNSIHYEILGEDLLNTANHIDTNANGIQVHGKEEISKVALGVSCSTEFLQKAVDWNADVTIFHHGLSISSYAIHNARLTPPLQKQLQIVFDNKLTVAGYHYTLDAHSEIGNNVQIIQQLGAIKTEETYFDGWGWIGEFTQPLSAQDILHRCSQLFNRSIYPVFGGTHEIKRIGVCSGGAKPGGRELVEMYEKHIDLHISGEIVEGGSILAKDGGFNYFSCGHYATEVFGIKALSEKIKAKFPQLEVEFIDVWNEL